MEQISICGCRGRSGRHRSTALLTRFQAKEKGFQCCGKKGKRYLLGWGECHLTFGIGCFLSALVKDLRLNPITRVWAWISSSPMTQGMKVVICPVLSEPSPSYPSITNHLIAVLFNCIPIKWQGIMCTHCFQTGYMSSLVYSALLFWAFWVASDILPWSSWISVAHSLVVFAWQLWYLTWYIVTITVSTLRAWFFFYFVFSLDCWPGLSWTGNGQCEHVRNNQYENVVQSWLGGLKQHRYFEV